MEVTQDGAQWRTLVLAGSAQLVNVSCVMCVQTVAGLSLVLSDSSHAVPE